MDFRVNSRFPRLARSGLARPEHGLQVLAEHAPRAEAWAEHSDPGFKEAGQLTVTYLTTAHQAAARQLVGWMKDAGFDMNVTIPTDGCSSAHSGASSPGWFMPSSNTP